MSSCPNCENPVYFAERVLSLGKEWHRSCLRCAKCNKVLDPIQVCENQGKPYCPLPCYNSLFGMKGYIRVWYK